MPTRRPSDEKPFNILDRSSLIPHNPRSRPLPRNPNPRGHSKRTSLRPRRQRLPPSLVSKTPRPNISPRERTGFAEAFPIKASAFSLIGLFPDWADVGICTVDSAGCLTCQPFLGVLHHGLDFRGACQPLSMRPIWLQVDSVRSMLQGGSERITSIRRTPT